MDDKFIKKRIYNTILRWTTYKKGNPVKMLLQTTYKCNLYCLFCENLKARKEGRFDYSKELSLKEWDKIITDSAKLGVRSWWISGGGEPMCNKEVTIRAIKKIKKLAFKTETCITTNGTEFNIKDIQNLVRNQLDLVIFSIDSPYQKYHDLLRGKKGTFGKAVKALHQFAAIKKKMNSKKPYIKISAIINRYNILYLREFVKFAKESGCQELSLCPLIIMKGIGKKLERYGVQIKEVTNKIIKEKIKAEKLAKRLHLKFDIRFGISYSSKDNEKKGVNKGNIFRSYCYEPYYFMLVSPFGNVSPCCIYGPGYNNLNLKNINLEEIWLSNEFQNLRDNLQKGIITYKCHNCELANFSREYMAKLVKNYKNG